MSDNCIYPDFAGLTSYRKGCRCLRCVDEKKQKRKKYDTTEHAKQKRKEKDMRYAKSEKRKLALLRYRKSEKGKNTYKKYSQSEYGKIMNRHRTSGRRQKMKCPLSLGDKQKIRLIYEECYRITQETGIPHHVDHIIPLALGGLHHPSNLQILTAEENWKKGCKLLA